MAAPHNQPAAEFEGRSGFSLQVGDFDGPFDLLLSLISKHELDITLVSLSKVTQEFINYIATLEGPDELDQASEFVVVAATLLDMKIVSLLPKGELVDAEDVAMLEARDLLFAKLLQYRAFKDVSAWFASRFELEAGRIAREVRVEERFKETRSELIWTIALADFAKLAEEVMTPKVIPGIGTTHLHAPRVSIREQAAEIIGMLRAEGHMTFRQIISSVTERAVVVARFLAVLELYRYSAISFEQFTPLGDLTINWVGGNFDDEELSKLGADYES